MKFLGQLLLFLCFVPLSAQQMQLAFAKNIPLTPLEKDFLATAAVACGKAVVINKMIQSGKNIASAYIPVFENECASAAINHMALEGLPGVPESAKHEYQQLKLQTETAKQFAQRKAKAELQKQLKKMACFAVVYAVLRVIAGELPPLYTSHSSQTKLEAVASFCVPLLAGMLTQYAVTSYFSPQQTKANAGNIPDAPPLISHKDKISLASIITICAVVLVQYYVAFKTHQYFQPYIMPTQHEHAAQFFGYNLAPALCNLIF